jgi:hypothetical protein
VGQGSGGRPSGGFGHGFFSELHTEGPATLREGGRPASGWVW